MLTVDTLQFALSVHSKEVSTALPCLDGMTGTIISHSTISHTVERCPPPDRRHPFPSSMEVPSVGIGISDRDTDGDGIKFHTR